MTGVARPAPSTRSARQPTAGLASVRLERLPRLDRVAPMDAAEAFRGLPGLALLESARSGRASRWSYLTADPLAVISAPDPGPDPFASARRLVARLDHGRPPMPPATQATSATAPGPRAAGALRWADAPPFLGGLVGYLGYDVGHTLERLPTIAPDDQGMAPLRLALHDWVVAWDRRAGQAWLAGRALDGDTAALDDRLQAVRERLARADQPAWTVTPALADHPMRAEMTTPAGHPAPVERPTPDRLPIAGFRFVSGLDQATYTGKVQAVHTAIARGDIYQANLARRLETPFRGDPWPLYRALRTGDPALFAAYLDVGPAADDAPRAIVSASPEPFLSVDRGGRVQTDPIKGTRPRGETPEEDRALAAELLASGKDRAENVMIVDVLRNDLGRVCRPGSVRVPRLCRLERTAAVQHLVSTVTGRLAPGRDAFDLLAASFPGGSITGAPKIRAMEILEELEPVRRGPYTGAALWLGPDGALGSSILIRTLVADGHRLTLHVGGGITWRSDPAAEWQETVVKARGPLRAINGREVGSEP